jgi:hypothetical protein
VQGDERFVPVAQNVKAHQERAVESAARGCLSVCRPEKILNAIPEQEFIGEYLLFAV